MTHRARSEVNIMRGAILSGFSPSGFSPNPTSLAPQIRNTAQKQVWGSIPPRSRYHTTERAVKTRAMGNFASISRASSGHRNTIKAQIKGISAQTSGPTSPTKLQTPEGRLTRFV